MADDAQVRSDTSMRPRMLYPTLSIALEGRARPGIEAVSAQALHKNVLTICRSMSTPSRAPMPAPPPPTRCSALP